MSSSQDALRRKWASYWRGWREAKETGQMHYPPMPDEFMELRCGAQTRAGTPCKIERIFDSGRCKLHGGLSTGPKSAAGKARARENGKLGGRGRRAKPTQVNGLAEESGESRPESGQPKEVESLQKPNPMDSSRFRQGLSDKERDVLCMTGGSENLQKVVGSDPAGTAPSFVSDNSKRSNLHRIPRVDLESRLNTLAAKWREFCAQRGIELPNTELPLIPTTNRVHIVPAPRFGRR
ncbi:MAG: hypothetical protein EOP50_03320 [Sphingobacteriales bacterium]|nr:MAG: hypothetical protein EOP50_03320 [Sphingobacteriales bacterium]